MDTRVPTSETAPEPGLAIETRGLTKTYGRVDAVHNVNLRVPTGALFGFLGPNGSGKSTTVKLLTGLLAPTHGDVRVAGQAVSAENVALRRLIGVLPEDDALFHSLTIREHMELCGPLYGLSHEATWARASELLRHLDLEAKSATYIDQASFGMRKKCALAMALLHNPHVLFLDEPLEGIDPGSSRNIRDLLIMLARKGVTIFLTSHVLEFVERLADHVAIIVNGHIVFCQTAEAIKNSGQTLEEIYFHHVGQPVMGNLEWLGRR